VTAFLLALLAAATPGAPPSAQAKTCIELVRTAPARAVDSAAEWRKKGGGLEAAQCEALALAALDRWADAAVAFEHTALEAERLKDLRSADHWVEAGNAWLAAGEPAKARKDLDTALATTLLSAKLRGEAHLDRARAFVAAGDVPAARSDIDKALTLVPGDPFAWYLSAALARRETNLTRARADIAKGLALAPEEPSLLLEAGSIAGVAGDVEAARGFYQRAAKAGPNTDSGRAAAAALAEPAPQPR